MTARTDVLARLLILDPHPALRIAGIVVSWGFFLFERVNYHDRLLDLIFGVGHAEY